MAKLRMFCILNVELSLFYVLTICKGLFNELFCQTASFCKANSIKLCSEVKAQKTPKWWFLYFKNSDHSYLNHHCFWVVPVEATILIWTSCIWVIRLTSSQTMRNSVTFSPKNLVTSAIVSTNQLTTKVKTGKVVLYRKWHKHPRADCAVGYCPTPGI